jgi:hypothetical protein
MSFADEIAAFVTKTQAKMTDTTKEALIETASDVVLGTPVVEADVPRRGAARGAWDAAGGEGEPDPIGLSTIARIAQQIEGHPVPGPDIVLSNGTDYIAALEFGSSQQAPAGFIRTSAARFPSHVERAARKRAND